MNNQDKKINNALRNSDDDGIVVMDGWRDYSIWMRCNNGIGELLAPTCFNSGYKSRHAARAAFLKAGGHSLSTRSLILF